MTPEEFVRRVRHDVIDGDSERDRRQFVEADRTHLEGSHPHWQRAVRLFDSLSPEEQETLFAMFPNTKVDTVARLFGVFDGTSQLYGRFERFKMSYWGSRHDDAPLQEEVVLSGDLQDYFFAQEQEEE